MIPACNDFEDGIGDLALYDGHIVGLVSRGNMTNEALVGLEAFIRKLLVLEPLPKDAPVWKEVGNYCRRLLHLASASLEQCDQLINTDKIPLP